MHSYTASGNDTDVSVTCRTDEDGNFLHWKERGGGQVKIFTHSVSFLFLIFKMILAPDGGPPSVNSTGISYTEISVIWTEPPRYHHNGILLGE